MLAVNLLSLNFELLYFSKHGLLDPKLGHPVAASKFNKYTEGFIGINYSIFKIF
jgi:hypothetical protein